MKEAYYFSHDANAQHDPKIIKLLSKLGWEGYGLYWAIVERLRNEPDYTLECDYDCIAFALRTHSDCIKSLVEDYDLFIIEDDIFYSESLLNRMKQKDERSEKARESARKRWKRNANALRTHSEPNAIKEKKVKESKVNKKKVNIDFSVFWDLYNKKVGDKSKVEKKWNNLKDIDRTKIMDTLPAFLKLIPDKQFQPYPFTYLNNRRWEDEMDTNIGVEFKKDVLGVSYIGYCEKCNKSDFYATTNEDSICCKTKILPKPQIKAKL